MAEWTTCRSCNRAIPKKGTGYCDLCAPSAPPPRSPNAPWSQGRNRQEQSRFRQRLMAAYGAQCCAIGGLTTYQDLPQGTRCPVIDVSRGGTESLEAHHGHDKMPDLLLCQKHHAAVDPHARVR